MRNKYAVNYSVARGIVVVVCEMVVVFGLILLIGGAVSQYVDTFFVPL